MIHFRPKLFRTIDPDQLSFVGPFAAFTIWVSIVVVSGGLLGCMLILVLWTIDALTGWQFRIAPRLSTATLSDRIAWLAFSFGFWAMYGITLMSSLSESDGDFRTWDEIRRHVRILLTAAFCAAAVPAFVAIWHFLDRQERHGVKNTFRGRVDG